MPIPSRFLAPARTVAVAAAGAALFAAIGLPLPLLLGPMFGCLAAALAGMTLGGFGPVSEGMRTVLGVAVGASITPALIGRLGEMALSVALIPLFILVIGLVGYPYFRRLCRFDPATAYYAAMPGGLQDMILFGEEAGGSARALSLVHATRVLVIVALMPPILTLGWGLDLTAPPGALAATVPGEELAIMLACAVIGWVLATRIGLFGASILGPLAVAAVASLSDILHHRPPAEAIWAAQFIIGATVGVKYVGITGGELTRVVGAALGFCLILTVLSILFATLAHWLGGAPWVEALLAFAPGGQAEMVVLALVAGADIAFVVTHHLVRLVVVITGAPIVIRWLR